MKSYNKTFVLAFAEYYHGAQGTAEDSFTTFLEEQEKPDPKPEPELGICEQVLEAAAEMCGVSMNELSNGRKYGNLPSCKQLTVKILQELKCSDATIASKLPQMGGVSTIKSRREAAYRYQKTEKNYRAVLNQLRNRFGIEIKS